MPSASKKLHNLDLWWYIIKLVIVFRGTDALVMTLPNGHGWKHTRHGKPYANGNQSWRTVWDIPVPDQEKKVSCPGRVLQSGDQYTVTRRHTCPGKRYLEELVEMNAEVKLAAKLEPWKTAKSQVEPIMLRFHEANPELELPDPNNLERVCSDSQGTKHPKTLDFELDPDDLPPDFFREDVKVSWGSKDPAWQLLFATNAGLKHLRNAKRWYVDVPSTFKLVRKPFTQLSTIDALIRKDGHLKQVPLFFILMSHRRVISWQLIGYCKFAWLNMFSLITEKRLQGCVQGPQEHSQGVEEIVSDFERAMWNAAHEVFKCPVIGCSFHWCQAVFRKIKQFGINTLYRKSSSYYKICRKLLTLNLLPASKIPRAFDRINKIGSRAGGPLKQLCDYINKQWIISSTFPSATWSVHGQFMASPWEQTTTQKGGTTGQTKRFANGRSNLSMFELIHAMHSEARTVNMQVKFLYQVTSHLYYLQRLQLDNKLRCLVENASPAPKERRVHPIGPCTPVGTAQEEWDSHNSSAREVLHAIPWWWNKPSDDGDYGRRGVRLWIRIGSGRRRRDGRPYLPILRLGWINWFSSFKKNDIVSYRSKVDIVLGWLNLNYIWRNFTMMYRSIFIAFPAIKFGLSGQCISTSYLSGHFFYWPGKVCPERSLSGRSGSHFF